MLQCWDKWPAAKGFECVHCWRERKRRARVLFLDEHPEIAKHRLQDPAFAEAVLITPFNDSVFYFAQQRAINFATATGAQSFWIQASDCPPAWFCSGYSTEDLLQLKKKWLSYHARKIGRDSLIVAGLLQHAIQNHTRQWARLQRVWHPQWLSLQTESLGFRRIRFANVSLQV